MILIRQNQKSNLCTHSIGQCEKYALCILLTTELTHFLTGTLKTCNITIFSSQVNSLIFQAGNLFHFFFSVTFLQAFFRSRLKVTRFYCFDQLFFQVTLLWSRCKCPIVAKWVSEAVYLAVVCIPCFRNDSNVAFFKVISSNIAIQEGYTYLLI